MLKRLLLILSLSTTAAFAEETNMTDPKELGETYFNALYQSDFDTVRKMLSPDIVFEDPTAPEGFGVPQYLSGKDDYLEFWEGSAAQLHKNYEITDSYESADYVTLHVRVHGTGAAALFGLEGDKIELNGHGVTVLHVKDGQIVRHLDFFDYRGVADSIRPVE